MAQRHKLDIKDTRLVLPHAAYADGVSTLPVAVQSRLRPGWVLVYDYGLRGRRVAAEGLGFADVGLEGGFHC